MSTASVAPHPVAPRPWWHLVIGWLGVVGQLVTLVFYAASGLVAPGWAVVTLLGVWVLLGAATVLLLRRRPLLVPLVPLLTAALWWGALTAGEAWLGWTA